MMTSTAPADNTAPSVLGSVKSNIQLSVNHLGSVTASNLDHYFPPAHRQASKEWLQGFAVARPYLASLVAALTLLSGPPLAFFLLTTATLTTFFILTGLLLGLLGALFFTLIAIGVGLAILVPVLFLTTVTAVSLWLWASVIFYLVRRLNHGRVPALPADLVASFAKVSRASGEAQQANGTGKGPTSG